MSRRAALSAWLVLSLAGIFSTTASAYVLHDHKWPSATTTFYVDIPGRAGLWDRAFETAMARWNDATVFEFRIRHTYEEPCDSPDGENGVDFAWDICGDFLGFTGLAVTRTWTRGTVKTETNITFNSAYSWDVYDGPNPGSFSAQDFRRVAVHELGHALGLAHEENVHSIMVSRMPLGSTLLGPQADDIADVAALYSEGPVAPPPPNDNFSNAIRIYGPSGRTTGSNFNATMETGESIFGTRSVWWQWTAPSSGTVTIDTVGSSFDTLLGVYTGTQVDALMTLSEDDDSATGTTSRVSLDVTAGTVYRLRVTGYPHGAETNAQGDIILNWNLEPTEHLFPQWVNGMAGGFSNRTRLVLRNLANWPNDVTVSYLLADGSEADSQSHFIVTVPGRGTVDLWTGGTGNMETGVITVEPQWAPLHATVIYELMGHRVSVPSARLTTKAEVFVSKTPEENTGLVVYNPNDEYLTLELVMHTTEGRPFYRIYATLEPGQQLTRFLDEEPFFDRWLGRRQEFTGHVVITTEGEQFAVMSLLQNMETGALSALSPAFPP